MEWKKEGREGEKEEDREEGRERHVLCGGFYGLLRVCSLLTVEEVGPGNGGESGHSLILAVIHWVPRATGPVSYLHIWSILQVLEQYLERSGYFINICSKNKFITHKEITFLCFPQIKNFSSNMLTCGHADLWATVKAELTQLFGNRKPGSADETSWSFTWKGHRPQICLHFPEKQRVKCLGDSISNVAVQIFLHILCKNRTGGVLCHKGYLRARCFIHSQNIPQWQAPGLWLCGGKIWS